VLQVSPGDIRGGLFGILILLCLCAGWGYLLVGRAARHVVGDLAEQLGLSTLVGFGALSWLGCILAVASLFNPWSLVLASLVLFGLFRSFFHFQAHTREIKYSTASSLGVLCVVAVAAWLFARPAETFLLFDDSAVYTTAGIHLARHGTLFPQVAPYACDPIQAIRYWGPYRWWDGCSSALAVGFAPLPKVWTAIAAWLFGDGGAVWIAPFSGVVGILALFLFVRRAIGPTAALVATTLVVISFPQIWFSRMLMSETFSMIALFSGLFLMSLARQNDDIGHPYGLGTIAVLLLGLLSMTRFEALLLLGILGAALLLSQWSGSNVESERLGGDPIKRWMLRLTAVSAIGFGLSVASTPYYYLAQLVHLMNRNTLRFAVVAAVVGCCLLALFRRERIRETLSVSTRKHWIAPALITLVIAVQTAFFVLSILNIGVASEYLASWIVAYLGVPLVVLGLVGITYMIWDSPTPELYAIVALAMIMCLQYSILPLVNPVHPWAMRRSVPFILPIYACGAAWVLQAVWDKVLHNPGRGKLVTSMLQVGIAVCFALAVYPMLRITAPFVFYQETAGLWAQLAELEESYPDDAVLAFDTGPLGTRLPQVMELVFDRGVISFWDKSYAGSMLQQQEAIAEILSAGGRVLFNNIDGRVSLDPDRFSLRSVGSYDIQAPRLKQVKPPPPALSDVLDMQFTVNIYDVTLKAE